jgi:hypothetical protein
VCSAVVPSLFSSFESAVTPHFDPVAFGLPADAKEVVKRRTEKAITFEITPGKFASVSTGDRVSEPSCDQAKLSMLCRAESLVHGIIPFAFATSQGPNSPGTVIDDNGTGIETWNNPSNASADDSSFATASSVTNGNTTHYLMATNFSFNSPSGSTIDGIIVEIKRKSSTSNVSQFWKDTVVKLVKGGTVSGDNKADVSTRWPLIEAIASYGTSSNLWGLTFTTSDINASNFGVVVSAIYGTICDPVDECSTTASVNHIRTTVYYTEAVAGVAPFFSWWSLPLMLAGCAWVLWKEGYLGGDMIQERI